MKFLGLALFLLICMPALAEQEGVIANTGSTRDFVSSPSKFHWLTRNCKVDEGDAIETTPGSPPLSVDDPATPGCNQWEFNFVVNGDFTSQDRTLELPLLDINYGIGDNLQLKYEVPNVVTYDQSGRTAKVGESKAGVKFQFYGDEENHIQLAVYPQMQFFISTSGSSASDEASAGTITTLPILLAKKIGTTSRGDVMLSANLGYNISTKSDETDFISAAVGVGAPLVARVTILGELVTEQSLGAILDRDRDQILKANVGFMSPLGSHFMVFGAVGKSLMASDERDHTYFSTGVRFLAGH